MENIIRGMKLGFGFLLDSLHDKDSAIGFGGLTLMASSTLIANFSLVIGMLTALGGLSLVGLNIMIKYNEYKKLKNEE